VTVTEAPASAAGTEGTEDQETEGLDVSMHNERGYNL
jgi:hypothetical protein